MIDEIQHLKLGFSTFAAAVEECEDADIYRQNLKRDYVTFAKIKRPEGTAWEVMDSSIFCLSVPSMLQYRHGSVYEVETQKRSLMGKTTNAEKYLDYYQALPTVCLTSLPSYALRGWMLFDNLQSEMSRGHAQGVEIASAVSFVDEGRELVKAEVHLSNAKQVVFFNHGFSRGKTLELICTGPEPDSMAMPLQAQSSAIYTENLSLF